LPQFYWLFENVAENTEKKPEVVWNNEFWTYLDSSFNAVNQKPLEISIDEAPTAMEITSTNSNPFPVPNGIFSEVSMFQAQRNKIPDPPDIFPAPTGIPQKRSSTGEGNQN
jgi:hypothetical protein